MPADREIIRETADAHTAACELPEGHPYRFENGLGDVSVEDVYCDDEGFVRVQHEEVGGEVIYAPDLQVEFLGRAQDFVTVEFKTVGVATIEEHWTLTVPRTIADDEAKALLAYCDDRIDTEAGHVFGMDSVYDETERKAADIITRNTSTGE